jgi:hypothetical protein
MVASDAQTCLPAESADRRNPLNVIALVRVKFSRGIVSGDPHRGLVWAPPFECYCPGKGKVFPGHSSWRPTPRTSMGSTL